MYKNGQAIVILRGNLTRDPEMKYTPNGAARTTGSVAINKTYKDKTGAMKESVSFIPWTAWGPTAERIAEFCRKGQEVSIVGELRQERYETDGKSNAFIHVVVERFDFGDKPKGGDAVPEEPAEFNEEEAPF